MDYEVECPGCGAWVVIFIDPGAGDRQEFEERCPDCGEAWTVVAVEEEAGGFAVGVAPRDA
jgi:ribosomal protein S27E